MGNLWRLEGGWRKLYSTRAWKIRVYWSKGIFCCATISNRCGKKQQGGRMESRNRRFLSYILHRKVKSVGCSTEQCLTNPPAPKGYTAQGANGCLRYNSQLKWLALKWLMLLYTCSSPADEVNVWKGTDIARACHVTVSCPSRRSSSSE